MIPWSRGTTPPTSGVTHSSPLCWGIHCTTPSSGPSAGGYLVPPHLGVVVGQTGGYPPRAHLLGVVVGQPGGHPPRAHLLGGRQGVADYILRIIRPPPDILADWHDPPVGWEAPLPGGSDYASGLLYFRQDIQHTPRYIGMRVITIIMLPRLACIATKSFF